MSLNRAELVAFVQKALGKETTKAAAERAVEAFVGAVKVGVKKGGVQLLGFGSFKIVNRKARIGRNPKTGQKIKIKASKSVKFSVGTAFKKSL